MLAHAPGDLRFRLALAQSIGNIHRDIDLLRQEIKTLGKRRIPTDTEIALIVHREVKPMQMDLSRIIKAITWFMGATGALLFATLAAYIAKLLGLTH